MFDERTRSELLDLTRKFLPRRRDGRWEAEDIAADAHLSLVSRWPGRAAATTGLLSHASLVRAVKAQIRRTQRYFRRFPRIGEPSLVEDPLADDVRQEHQCRLAMDRGALEQILAGLRPAPSPDELLAYRTWVRCGNWNAVLEAVDRPKSTVRGIVNRLHARVRRAARTRDRRQSSESGSTV